MNLNQKEKLKQKLDDLEALISCVDQSWYIEHTQIPMGPTAGALFYALLNMTDNDDYLAMALLLRMTKTLVSKMKFELEYEL